MYVLLSFLQLGYTSLHVASWKGQVAVVEMLVREGCNATAQSYDCKTPLQLAQEEEQHECVTILQAVTSRVRPFNGLLDTH